MQLTTLDLLPFPSWSNRLYSCAQIAAEDRFSLRREQLRPKFLSVRAANHPSVATLRKTLGHPGPRCEAVISCKSQHHQGVASRQCRHAARVPRRLWIARIHLAARRHSVQATCFASQSPWLRSSLLKLAAEALLPYPSLAHTLPVLQHKIDKRCSSSASAHGTSRF